MPETVSRSVFDGCSATDPDDPISRLTSQGLQHRDQHNILQRLHYHLLAYVYNMHFASVDAGRKRCEDDDQWWCNEPDALGLPAGLLPHTLQCCRHAIDADIEGKLCRFHVYT